MAEPGDRRDPGRRRLDRRSSSARSACCSPSWIAVRAPDGADAGPIASRAVDLTDRRLLITGRPHRRLDRLRRGRARAGAGRRDRADRLRARTAHHAAHRPPPADRAAACSSSTSTSPSSSPPSPPTSRSGGGASTASCTRSRSRRRTRWAATSSTRPPSRRSSAFGTSAYSLKSLAVALAAAAGARRAAARSSGLDFDATVAWPVYDWMGVAKAALESVNRYLARDLGPAGVRANLVSAGPLRTMAARRIAGFDLLAGPGNERAPLHWDVQRRRARSPTRPVPALRPGPRRSPGRSCTSTAATTRWARR